MNFRIVLNNFTRVSYSTSVIPFGNEDYNQAAERSPICGGNFDCRSFNLFDYCCSPFQTSLISPKRLSLHKVMRTSILVSSSRLKG